MAGKLAQSACLVTLTAACTAGIVKNHPFTDGNKPTGFIIGILFLELIGGRLTANEENTAAAALALASGTCDEPEYAAFSVGMPRLNERGFFEMLR